MKMLNLNPVSNAKTVGYLSIFMGVSGAWENYSLLSKGFTPVILYFFLWSLASLVVGFGLIKTKKWGLYGLLALTGINTLYQLYYLSTKPPIIGIVLTLVIAVISLLFSVWIYKAKDKFL